MQAAIKKLGIDLTKTDFFVTHGHGDHAGLVPRLIQAKSVAYINKLEADFIQKIESGAFLLETRDFYRMSGLPEEGLEKIVPLLVRSNLMPADTSRFQFLKDGDILAGESYRFTCIETPGHSKGHMCLYEPDRKILASGDHLLKDAASPITGRIVNDNPLKEYLLSLDKVFALDIDIVLPGHGRSFRNAKQRIKETKEHHHQENRKVLSILGEGGKNVYETSLRMTLMRNIDLTNPFSVLQSVFIVEQAFAYLRYLEEEGRIKRTTEGKVAIYTLSETC